MTDKPAAPPDSPAVAARPADAQAADLPLYIDCAPPPVDIETFDPSEFDWKPVPRRPRRDGWTPEVQRRFIEVLADTGLVSQACEAVDMSQQSAFRLRRSPGSESFARAWEAATSAAATRLIDVAFSRAIEGFDIPIFDRDGCRIGAKQQYSDRLMMFLLRAYRPDRFRDAHRAERAPGEALPPREVPVAQAIAAMHPVPAEPHRLMEPDRLAGLVQVARYVVEGDARDPENTCNRERFSRAPLEEDSPAARYRRAERHERERRRDERGDLGLTFD